MDEKNVYFFPQAALYSVANNNAGFFFFFSDSFLDLRGYP